jgi:hypothetical protein
MFSRISEAPVPRTARGQETIARLAKEATDLGHVQFHPVEDLADLVNLISLNFLQGGF